MEGRDKVRGIFVPIYFARSQRCHFPSRNPWGPAVFHPAHATGTNLRAGCLLSRPPGYVLHLLYDVILGAHVILLTPLEAKCWYI